MIPGPEQHHPDETPAEDDAPQQLQGFMGNDEWDALIAHANNLIRELVNHPDEKTRKKIIALLQAIDAMHREPLTRLVRLFKDGVLEKVVTDPPIHTLMELYDMLPAEKGDPAQAPPERPSTQRPFPNIPIRVESKSAEKSAPKPHPHWVPALNDAHALPQGDSKIVMVADKPILLCHVDEHFFALDAECGRDGASLEQATLSRYTLVCPAHPACYYDIRQGTRVGGPEKIQCYPVQVTEGNQVQVGFGMPFVPKLPSF